MKIKRRVAVAAAVVLLIFAAVIAAVYSRSSTQPFSEKSMTSETADPSAQDSSKVITNVYMSIETKEFDKSIDTLNSLTAKYSGFIENSNIGYSDYLESRTYRSGYFTIRVPKADVEPFKADAVKIGNVISESTSKSDITKQYVDTESKLNMLKIKEERLLSLLEQAVNIEDIIKLEESLNDVMYEKEALINEIKSMDEQVDYSTVSLSILEVDRYSTSDAPDTSIGQKIAEAFKSSLYVFKLVVEKLLIAAIYILPFAAAAALVYFILNKIRNRKNKI